MIRWLTRTLVASAIAIPVMALLPFAAVALTRTPTGAEVWLFAGPWSCAFWVLIYSQLSLVPWRQGRAAVLEWKLQHNFVARHFFACSWMFGALVCSYAAEFLMLFARQRFVFGVQWLPAATFSPIAYCWLWRRFFRG